MKQEAKNENENGFEFFTSKLTILLMEKQFMLKSLKKEYQKDRLIILVWLI